MIDLVVSNLTTRVLGGEFLLVALLFAGVSQSVRSGGWRRPEAAPRLVSGSIVGLFCAEVLAVEFALRWGPSVSASWTEGLALLHRTNILAAVVLAARTVELRPLPLEPARLFSLLLIVPWTFLLLVAEEGGERRFIGLWPMQAIAVALGLVHLIDRATRRWIRVAAAALVAAVVAGNLVTVTRLRDWQAHGWSGQEAPSLLSRDYRVMVCE